MEIQKSVNALWRIKNKGAIMNKVYLQGKYMDGKFYTMVGDKPETKTAYEICCSDVVAHGKENYYGKE